MGGRSVVICEGVFFPRTDAPRRFDLLLELLRLNEAKLPGPAAVC